MGNGAGKNKNVVREIGPDDDIVDGNDDYYERLEEQAKKGSTASKPMLGGLFGAKKERAKVQKKKAPKIVGLIDSDEEDQGGGGDAVGGASRDDGARQAAREPIYNGALVFVCLISKLYREVQLDFTPEMEVFFMLYERCHIENIKRSFKQHMKCLNFRS